LKLLNMIKREVPLQITRDGRDRFPASPIYSDIRTRKLAPILL